MAIQALQRYSQAEKGHRTMVDALIPAQEAFSEAVNAGTSCPHRLWTDHLETETLHSQ